MEKNIYKEVTKMTVSYKKLWKLLIDRDMKKKDLQAAAGISPSSISKLSKNEYVSMDVLVKVCTALGVDFKDIMELVPNMVEESPVVICQAQKNNELEIILAQTQNSTKKGYIK